MEWPGHKAYAKTELSDLKLSDEGAKVGDIKSGSKVGLIKSSGNLTFINIHAAGHMVPYNQPEASLDMVNRWVAGEWLA